MKLKGKITTMEELLNSYKTKGTEYILEELPNSIKDNLCIK